MSNLCAKIIYIVLVTWTAISLISMYIVYFNYTMQRVYTTLKYIENPSLRPKPVKPYSETEAVMRDLAHGGSILVAIVRLGLYGLYKQLSISLLRERKIPESYVKLKASPSSLSKANKHKVVDYNKTATILNNTITQTTEKSLQVNNLADDNDDFNNNFVDSPDAQQLHYYQSAQQQQQQQNSASRSKKSHAAGKTRVKRRAHLQQAPSFSQPIGNVTAVLGRDVRLICTVDNLGHYQVAWMKLESKTILSIDTNIITTNYRIFLIPDEEERKWVLHIKDVQESDRGYYQCQLNTIPMRSITGHLEVVVAPSIIESQSSQQVTVDEYSNVTLTCKTYARPKAVTTWKRDDGLPIRLVGGRPYTQTINSNTKDIIDDNIDNDYHLTGVVKSRLNEVEAQDSYHRLNITNNDNRKNNQLIDLLATTTTINLDEASIDGTGGAISGSSNLFRSAISQIAVSSSVESQYKSEKLILTNVNRTFTGVYICSSTNGIPPSAIKKIPLYINFPPKTSLLNQYISANIGDVIELECIIEAYPKSSNHWAKMPSGGDVTWTHILGPDHGNVVEGTLLDGASSNNNNNSISTATQIHLTYHPHNRLNNRSLRDKVLVNVSNTLQANELMGHKQQLSVENNSNNSNDERVYVSVKQNSVNSYTNQLKLTIPSLRRQDFGKYTCFARNSLGVSESSVLIREITKSSEYLSQRPLNIMQSDYPDHQRSMSIVNQTKKVFINSTQRPLMRHQGVSNYGDHSLVNKIVYDEKYIQAIKARQQNLNQNYNSNVDKTIQQRLKLKNAQSGCKILLPEEAKLLIILMIFVTSIISSFSNVV